jgi:hypothetical protein
VLISNKANNLADSRSIGYTRRSRSWRVNLADGKISTKVLLRTLGRLEDGSIDKLTVRDFNHSRGIKKKKLLGYTLTSAGVTETTYNRKTVADRA